MKPFRTDDETRRIYGTDWSGLLAPNPSAVAFPESTDEVTEILRHCSSRRIAVVPSGGRTGLSGGAVAANGELVLSLEKMNRMGEPDLRALTLEVEAGAITEAVHARVAPYGLTWPVDFASKGSSHVGGNIATNAGGVRVIRYGSTRHWVLGLTAVTMSGEVLRLNGALEKNNTGLDLRQLLIGSEGVLAVVTEATLKLCRLPEAAQVILLSVRDFPKVIELFGWARAHLTNLSAFECMSRSCYERTLRHFGLKAPVVPDCGAVVLIEVESTETPNLEPVFAQGLVIDGVIAQNDRDARDFWRIREGIAESILSRSTVHQQDISVPIACLEAFAEQVEQRYASAYPDLEVYVFGHIGDGNLHVFIRKPDAMGEQEFWRKCEWSDRDLFSFVRDYKGSVSAEHGVGLLKKPALPYSRSALELELFRRIKREWDPDGLLNPGKMIDEWKGGKN